MYLKSCKLMIQVLFQLFQAQHTGCKDGLSCSVPVYKYNNFCASRMMKGHVVGTSHEN